MRARQVSWESAAVVFLFISIAVACCQTSDVKSSMQIGVLLGEGDLERSQAVTRAAQNFVSDVILPSNVTLEVTVAKVSNSFKDWCDLFKGQSVDGLVLAGSFNPFLPFPKPPNPEVPLVVTEKSPHSSLPLLFPTSRVLWPRGRAVSMLDAMLDTFRSEQKTRLVFFYDSTVDTELRRYLMVAAAMNYLEVAMVNTNKHLSFWVRDVVKGDNSSQSLVVFASHDTVQNLSKQLEMSGDDYSELSWLILAPELTKDFLDSIKYLLPTSRFLTEWPFPLGLGLNLSQPNISNTLDGLNETHFGLADGALFDGVILLAEYMLATGHLNRTNDVTSWCTPGNTSSHRFQNGFNITQFHSNRTILPVTPFDKDGVATGSTFHLLSAMAVNDSYRVTPRGKWTRHDKLHLTASLHLVPGQDFNHLNNKTLTVGVLEASPFTIKGPNSTWSGFSVDILQELAKLLNFSYVFVEPPDKSWGAVEPDGRWNGLVGMAVNKEIDVAIGPLTLTNEREEVVDFTTPYMEDWTGILVKQTEDEASKMFRTFKPFTLSTWASVGAAIVVVGLCLFVANRTSPLNASRHDSADVVARRRSLLDNVWVVYESYMEQGAEVSPGCASGKLILGLWWVFTIVFAGTYTAGLAASLTVAFKDKPIHSLEDLAAQTDVKPLIKRGSYLASFFKNGESPAFRKIWQLLRTAPEVDTSEEAMGYVLEGSYALLTDYSQVETLRMTDCQSLQIGDKFNKISQGFLVQQDSPLRRMFSLYIIKLQESGLIEKWRQKWWSTTSTCPPDSNGIGEVTSLELDSTAGPFIVFTACTLLALLVLGLEILVARVVAWHRSGVQPALSTATSIEESLSSEDPPQGVSIFRTNTRTTLVSQTSYPSCLGEAGALY